MIHFKQGSALSTKAFIGFNMIWAQWEGQAGLKRAQPFNFHWLQSGPAALFCRRISALLRILHPPTVQTSSCHAIIPKTPFPLIWKYFLRPVFLNAFLRFWRLSNPRWKVCNAEQLFQFKDFCFVSLSSHEFLICHIAFPNHYPWEFVDLYFFQLYCRYRERQLRLEQRCVWKVWPINISDSK